MKTIYVLWLRSVKKYFRSPARMIGSLGQPFLLLFALGYGLKPVFEHAGQGNYLEFLAPGVIAMTILFTAMFSGIEMIWDRQFGFLKETLVAPVSRLSIMTGRTLGGATVAIFQAILVLIISFIAGFRMDSYSQLPLALLAAILIAILFTALGTGVASILEDMQGFQLIMNFLVMPLYFLSGTLFPLVGLPKLLDIITKINPLTYGVDALRSTLTAQSHFALSTDFGVLFAVTAAFLILGAYLFSKIQI